MDLHQSYEEVNNCMNIKWKGDIQLLFETETQSTLMGDSDRGILVFVGDGSLKKRTASPMKTVLYPGWVEITSIKAMSQNV